MHSSFLVRFGMQCINWGIYRLFSVCVCSNTLSLTLNNFFGNPEKKDRAKEVKKAVVQDQITESGKAL